MKLRNVKFFKMKNIFKTPKPKLDLISNEFEARP